MLARRFLDTLGKSSLFVLQVRKRGNNISEKQPIIDFDILKKCGFDYDKPSRHWWESVEFVYPLSDSSEGHNISPDKLAVVLAEILKKTSEAI